MLQLRIYGTTSRQAFSRQLRRCVAQQGPTAGGVKPGGGTDMWERSLLPSGKLSRHGRLVKALEHHTMQPNALPDMQCIMLTKKLTRRSYKNIDPKSSELYHLANQFRLDICVQRTGMPRLVP